MWRGSVEVVGLTGLSGLVDTLQDTGDHEGLLGQNAGIGVGDDGIDPLCGLQDGGIAAGYALKEGGTLGIEGGLQEVLAVVADTVDADAVVEVTAGQGTADQGSSA